MFGMGKGDDDKERFWNLVMFKIWATDKELEDMMPIAVVIILLAIGAVLLFG